MMKAPMTLEKAREIAHALSIAHAKHGAQLRSPYPQYDIIEALGVLHRALETNADESLKAAKDMVTAANRRAGAAESRLKRCMKGVKEEDPKEDPDARD